MNISRSFAIAVLFLFSSAVSAQIRTPYDSLALQTARIALREQQSYAILADLCTSIGARLTGSPEAARAVAWAQQKMKGIGLSNVHLQNVRVPHWIRGRESGFYTIGGRHRTPLHLTALGGSIGTPARGISGVVIEVDSWEQLKTLGDSVRGSIVFFNRPMDPSLINPGEAYGRAVDQRVNGAIEASKLGAAAVLVRSMTMGHDNIPHTGQMRYDSAVVKIPAAAIGIHDAEAMHAELALGKRVVATVKLGCKQLPDVESANVIGEIPGTEKPQEIVLIGAHLDSWDKGQGAQDDGAGCAHVLDAMRLIKEMNLHPKRTIRVVLFINEENGLSGGLAYAAGRPANETTIAAIETDNGGFSPRGFTVSDSSACVSLQQRFAGYLEPLGADRFTRGHGGADVGPLERAHIPALELRVDNQKYFDVHHSDNDVLENVNARELALGAAAVADLAYLLAQEGLDK